MEKLLRELEKYKHYKFTYSLSYVKKLIIDENFIPKIVKIANKKISQNIINETNKFIIYTFVLKNDSQYKQPTKTIYNTFSSKFFKTNKMKFIENLIKQVDKNQNLKFSEFKVDFYILPSEEKIESKNFLMLFKLIREKTYKIKKEYNKSFFTNPITSFFIGSYYFITKHYIIILGSILLLAFFQSRLKLLRLGLPSEIISNTQILSILKLYTVAYTPLVLLLGLLLIIYFLILLHSSEKKEAYKILKVTTATVAYILFGFTIYSFYLININKSHIKTNDKFLIEYFYESYYPRFATRKNNQKSILLLGEANKKTYFYELDKLKFKNHNKELCKVLNIKNHPYEKSIITLLKYSNYTHTKTIDYTNKLEIENTLDKNKVLNLLKEKYCLSFDNNNTTKK